MHSSPQQLATLLNHSISREHMRCLLLTPQIDGRGIEVPPVKPGVRAKRETVVVLKPLYNFTPAVFGPLIDRHVDYYAQMGVTKHIIYLRREHIPQMLMGNPKVARYVQVGRIMLILWDQLAEHEVNG